MFQFTSSLSEVILHKDQKSDAIVVLTGGSKRLDEGLLLLQNNMAERLFVSGVYEGIEVRTLLKVYNQKQLDLGRRVFVGGAQNTRENALETSKWMEKLNLNSLRLVTAAYHMPRALLEFKYAMPKMVVIAHPVFPEHVKHKEWWKYSGTTMLLASEYNKFIIAWVRQTLDQVFSFSNSMISAFTKKTIVKLFRKLIGGIRMSFNISNFIFNK